jgi:hypothetical protein
MERSQSRRQDREGNEVAQYWSAYNKRLKTTGETHTATIPRASAKLKVSPTPSVIIGTGAPQSDRVALVTPWRTPARVT